MTIIRTNSENINTTNIDFGLYIIPQKRPYVIPQKRTEKQQRIYDTVNCILNKIK